MSMLRVLTPIKYTTRLKLGPVSVFISIIDVQIVRFSAVLVEF